jgi:hypothetical protein
VSAIKVNGGNQRLARVGEQRLLAPAAGLFLAAAENHVLPEVEPLGELGKRRRRHQHRFDFRFLPFGGVRKAPAQPVGDHQPEDRVAKELERFVVDDAPTRILVRFRLVRQRVLEQAAIPEAIADAGLERAELLRQRHHLAAAHFLPVTLNHPNRIVRLVFTDGDLRLAHGVDGKWKDAGRRRGGTHRLDPVAVEQRLHHAGLDVRGRAEDDRQVGHVFPGA